MELDLFGWFPKENETILARLIQEYDIKTVIEIGSFLGCSTVFFAHHCDHVTAVDHFRPHGDEYTADPDVRRRLPTLYQQFLFNLRATGVMHKVTVLHMPSLKAAQQHIFADLIFIDGSHNYQDVKQDIEAWFPYARKVICGDDYTPSHPGVRRAVDEAPFQANTQQRVWYYVK